MTPQFAAGSLVVLVGISGSGKTTFAARYPASWRVSLDQFREQATDDMTDQSATPVAAQIQALLLDARLARGRTTIVDSTNVMPHVRRTLLARARYWQVLAYAVLFDLPRALCEAQNAGRARQVPPEVLRAQHAQLPNVEQLLSEGFTDVQVVSDMAVI